MMWSHIISLSDLPDGKLQANGDRDTNASLFVELNSRDADLEDIAGRLMVPSVQSITATIEIYRPIKQRTLIMVQAEFEAQCHLQCGVTLEPFATVIQDTITQTFSTKEITPANEEDDVPEYIADGELDVADVVLQLIAISTPAYPRKPNIKLEDVVTDKETVNQPEQKENPFASLADLKGKL